MRRRLSAHVVAVVGVLLGTTAVALAYFTATGAGSAQAILATISAPSSVTVEQSAGDITISWGAATLSSGGAVQGYRVTRSDGSNVCGNPTLVSTLSCTDAAVPTGTYMYTVTAIYNSWDASATSASITVLTAPTIGATPPNPSANRAPSFSFSGGGGTSYQCSLDGGSFSTCSSPQSYSSLADGSHTFKAHAVQGTSTGPDATYTWTTDTAAPTITSSPPSATSSTSASFSFSDSESSYTFKCQLDSGSFTVCASPTSYTGLANGSHTFKVQAFSSDGASTAVASDTWVVDTVAPTQSLALAGGASGAYLNAPTVYYRGNASGSFQLVDTVVDSGSGPASGGFPNIATTGWTHAAETVTAPAGGPFTSSAFIWTASPSNPSAYTVTGKDAAGNPVTTSLSFVNDSTAPSGGSVSVNGTAGTGAGSTSHTTTTSFAIGSRTDYTETQSSTQSGLQSSTLTIQSETFSADTCGAPGSGGPYTTATTITGTTNPTITSGYCYLYTLTGTDNVGNTASVKTTVQVDATPPTTALSLSNQSGGGSYLTGTTLYYKGSTAGSFKITNTLTDANSGPASSTFAALGGTATGWTFTGSTVSTPSGGPYVSNALSWAANTTTAPTEQITGTDAFGNTNTPVTLSFVNDSTAPSGGSVSVNGTAGTGAGSTSHTTTTSFAIGSRTDYTETQSSTQSGLQSSTLTIQSETFSADTCGAPGSGGPYTTATTITGTTNPTITSGYCYLYTLTGTDNVGNTASVKTTVQVDATAPTNALSLSGQSGAGSFLSGTTLYYRGSAAGSLTITNALTDANSGPASSTFTALGGTATGWTFSGSVVNTPGGGPYVSNALSWAATTTTAPTEQITGADAFGNTSPVTLSLVDDITPPSGGSVSGPAYATGAPVSVSFTAGTDSQSGIAASTGKLLRASATYTPATDTCGTFGAFAQVGATGLTSPYSDPGVTAGNCYEYEYTVSDQVGNSVTYGPSAPVKVDSTAPTVTGASSLDAGGSAADGLVQMGDQLILTFSEPLNPSTVPTSFAATTQSRTCPITSGAGECRSSTAGNVVLIIPGITPAAGANAGSAGYLTGTGAQTVGLSGTITLSSNNTVVTITVSSVNPLGGAGVAASKGKLAFTPASTITDNAGNAATGTNNTPGNFKLF